MRVSSFITIALVLLAAFLAQSSAMELSNQAARNLLQEEEKEDGEQDCSGLGIIDKANCLASNAADTVTGAAGSASGAVVDTFNSVVYGDDKNGTDSAAAPSSSAVAASGFGAVAVATTIFALAY